MEATRHPLAACYLLVDAMEALVSARTQPDKSVTSDFYGVAAVIATSFTAVMMAVNANLEIDLVADTVQRTESGRAQLQARLQDATDKLGLS